MPGRQNPGCKNNLVFKPRPPDIRNISPGKLGFGKSVLSSLKCLVSDINHRYWQVLSCLIIKSKPLTLALIKSIIVICVCSREI